MEYLRKCSDNQFDLAIVDPPYGINAENMQMGSNPNRSRADGHGSGPGISTAVKSKKNRLQRLNGGGGKLKNRLLNRSEINWDYEIPSPEYFEQLKRVSKNQIIWGGNYFPLPPTRGIVAWNKLQPWDNFSQFELAWTTFDRPAKLYRVSSTGGNNTEEKIHPTQKPLKLFTDILLDYGEEGNTVLDCYAGSMTTAIAAMKTNRRFICIEKDAEYYEKGVQRAKEYEDAHAYRLEL